MSALIKHLYRFGEFTLDADQKVLTRDGKPLLLAPKVVDTLVTLVQSGGRIIEKEELMTRLWPDTYVEESNLTYTIVQLRKMLGDDARRPRYIETIPKRGYRFIIEVEEALSDMGSIAVLPFLDLSPERDQEYFCEGLADELINSLASLPNLHVASRTSSFRFKSPMLDIREVGRRLNVSTVLEGSVRKAGSNFRITAQLVSAVDGYQLWSGKYDRRLEDIFAVQEDIAQSTVSALQVVLSSDAKRALHKVPTSSIEAYECYLRGRQLFYQMRRRSLESARQLYLRAIEMDDHFGPAYAGIADCSAFLYMDWGGHESDLVDAEQASSKAIEIDPSSSQVHASRGMVLSLSGRFSEAEREFETALDLNPRLYEAHYYFARACFSHGELDRAAELLERAIAINPDSIDALSMLGGIYRGQKREELKRQTLKRCLEAVENHLEFYPSDIRPLLLGATALIELGETKRGLEWTWRALELDSQDPNVLYNAACAFSLAGELVQAITCLEKSLPFCADPKWLDYDSYLDPLRSLPRFQELLRIRPSAMRR